MLTSFRIIVRAVTQFNTNNAYQMGAALAYYMLFSLAPLLLIAISIAGMVFGKDAAEGKVSEYLEKTIDEEPARLVESTLENADQVQSHTWAPQIGVILLFFVALQAFLHIRYSFCTIWEIEPPHKNTFLGVLISYVVSIIMVICVGLLLLISLIVATVLAYIQSVLPLPIPGGWYSVEIGVSFLLLTLAFATLYWVLSGRTLPLLYVLYGSVICAVLFSIGKFLLSWYLAFTTTTSVYGAAGSLVGFLIWIYYSSLVVFFGAELIQARRTRLEWMK